MNTSEAPIFRAVAKASELEEGQMLHVDLEDERSILLCRVGDRIYAVCNRCTHANASLHLGCLQGYHLICPLHAGTFDIRDGTPLCAPVTLALETYAVRVSGDDIEVALPKTPVSKPTSGLEW